MARPKKHRQNNLGITTRQTKQQRKRGKYKAYNDPNHPDLKWAQYLIDRGQSINQVADITRSPDLLCRTYGTIIVLDHSAS